MPTCRDMSELVTDYLERVVALRTRLDMWWHLCRCEACRRYYDQMRRTVRLLGSRPTAALDQEAEEGVLAAVRDGRPRDSGRLHSRQADSAEHCGSSPTTPAGVTDGWPATRVSPSRVGITRTE